MNIVFRTDASIQIGSGHVMRCLTLADEIRRQGHNCSFICRDHPGHLGGLIAKKGYGLKLLPAPDKVDASFESNADPVNAGLLGVHWQVDVEQTLAGLDSAGSDWLVVDHYALDARWEKQVSRVIGRTMVIDDLADRDHQADILVDQNALSRSIEMCYKKRVNAECNLLLGPHYALLGQDYSLLANALPDRNGEISRVLIFVGGSDPHHLTERYLRTLDDPEFRHLHIDVVIGSNHSAPEAVSDLVSRREHARIYFELPSLSALIIRADLMLGAGGSTNWERMCLGLNSVVVSVARNQYKVNQALERKGLIYFLGKAQHANIDMIRSVLKQILDSPLVNLASSRRMREIVDGNGCHRVVQTLLNRRKT